MPITFGFVRSLVRAKHVRAKLKLRPRRAMYLLAGSPRLEGRELMTAAFYLPAGTTYPLSLANSMSQANLGPPAQAASQTNSGAGGAAAQSEQSGAVLADAAGNPLVDADMGSMVDSSVTLPTSAGLQSILVDSKLSATGSYGVIPSPNAGFNIGDGVSTYTGSQPGTMAAPSTYAFTVADPSGQTVTGGTVEIKFSASISRPNDGPFRTRAGFNITTNYGFITLGAGVITSNLPGANPYPRVSAN